MHFCFAKAVPLYTEWKVYTIRAACLIILTSVSSPGGVGEGKRLSRTFFAHCSTVQQTTNSGNMRSQIRDISTTDAAGIRFRKMTFVSQLHRFTSKYFPRRKLRTCDVKTIPETNHSGATSGLPARPAHMNSLTWHHHRRNRHGANLGPITAHASPRYRQKRRGGTCSCG